MQNKSFSIQFVSGRGGAPAEKRVTKKLSSLIVET